MLKALRRKFVLIIMALVGTVLISVLGGSFVSAWQTQHDIIQEALDRGIEGELPNFPRMGQHWSDDDSKDGGSRRANILVLSADLDANGILIATNNAPAIIDSNTLAEVLGEALLSDSDEVWDDARHIVWKRKQRESGAWRVVIADTSATDISLQSLLFKDLAITAVAMGILLLISIGLSTWVLQPVQQAWNQQRRFIADASHELKTPLAVIIANTQILSDSPTLAAEDRQWVERTADEAAHMKNLVEELLELARTDESAAGSTGVMHKQSVDFSNLVENATLEFDAIAFEQGTSIDESIEEGITVSGDPEWLGRLAKILIDNACKYADGGQPVTVSLARDGRKCTLKVNNHGNVIDEQDLPHVFDRFYRTDKARSRTDQAGGFGLGLAIAKGIATSHGGDILVSSNEQQGTTFTVVLPVEA